MPATGKVVPKRPGRTATPAAPTCEVVLVSMPFGPVFWPSFGLSLLKSGLSRADVSSEIRYYTLDFATEIGHANYDLLSMTGHLSVFELAGEWVFSRALFGGSDEDATRYVEEVLVGRAGSLLARPPAPARVIRAVLGARARAEKFLDRCLADVVRRKPRLVGFTSTFQQHVASLALARRVRDALSEVTIAFGGANCESVMGAETLRRFPFVDIVVSGEADEVFPEIVRRTRAGESLAGLTGVRTRADVAADFAAGRFASVAPVRDLDSLPRPDFGDYFAQFGASRFQADWQPGVFVETSRGCWWGERHHCTFCGLNGQTMSYRSKSPARALDEFEWLGSTYPGCDIQVVDNILDLGYFKTLLPQLAARGLDFGLFYETKSNLKKEQVRLLGQASVKQIQPGIESLSDEVLKIMQKGVSGLQNIQLLKWCRQYGVKPLWNFLWGFPGEPVSEYDRMARLVPWLSHLDPPVSVHGLRLDRFSPSFDHAERMGFTDVAPLPAYAHVYRLPDEAIRNLAYHFGYRYRTDQRPAEYLPALIAAIRSWRRTRGRSALVYADTGSHLVLWDLRPARRQALRTMTGLERALLLACDEVTDRRRLLEVLAEHGIVRDGSNGHGGTTDAEAELDRVLDPLVTAGIVLREGSRYLGLALSLAEFRPEQAIIDRMKLELGRLGRRTRAGVVIPADRDRNGQPSRKSRQTPVGVSRPQPVGRHWTPSPERFVVNGQGELVVRYPEPNTKEHDVICDSDKI